MPLPSRRVTRFDRLVGDRGQLIAKPHCLSMTGGHRTDSEKNEMTMKSLCALLLATALAAPSGAALAEDGPPASIGAAIGSLFEGANLRRSAPPPADFVVRSRPAELDYQPLARPAAEPPKTRDPSQLQKLEKELAAAAAANRSRAARIRVPDGGAGPKARGQ